MREIVIFESNEDYFTRIYHIIYTSKKFYKEYIIL